MEKGLFWQSTWIFVRNDFLIAGLLKLLGDVTSLVGPLEVSNFLTYVAINEETSVKTSTYWSFLSNGWVIAIIVLVAAIAQSILSQMSTHIVNVRAIQLRTALQAKIYAKTLKCPKTLDVDDEYGNVTNLLTEDTNNIMSAIGIAHYVWAIPVKIGVILFLLYQTMGISCVIGSIITILLVIPMQFFIGRKMSSNGLQLNDLTDERLQKMTGLIEKIKLAKILGWEFELGKKILSIRDLEIEKLNKDSIHWASMTLLTHLSAVVIAIVSLGVHMLLKRKLTPQSVFTAFALFDQLTVPIFVLPVILPVLITGLTSGKRLEIFFAQQELTPTHPMTNNTAPSAQKRYRFNSTSSLMESLGDCEDDEEVADFVDSENRDHSVIIENAEFTWGPTNTLLVDQLRIPKGKLTVVGGSTGSGKSLLLSAILGEIKKVKGLLTWQRDVRIAYVSQTPWLINGTVRDNILFGKTYRQNRYDQVILACALQPDLDILPEKDLTEIGDRGVVLSGGQRQRIAIARALYSQANFIIMDDPLSSLDVSLATHVFDAGIKRLIRRGKRTVLLTTSFGDLFAKADWIIIMESARIAAQGTLEQINNEKLSFFDHLKQKPESRSQTENERWLLGKNVLFWGLENNNPFTETWQNEEPLLTRKRTTKRHFHTFSEWNYLTPNLSMSADEQIMPLPWSRQHETKNKQFFRANSLQIRPTRLQQAPLIRQFSSPLTDGRQRSKSSVGLQGPLLRHLLQQNIKKNHLPLHRVASNESSISDSASEYDPSEYEDIEVALGGHTNDEREYGRIPNHIYLTYIKATGAGLAGAFVAFTIIWRVVQVLTDVWLSSWSESEVDNEMFYLLVYCTLSVSAFLLSAISHSLGQLAGGKARKKLHEDLFDHVLKCSVNVFETTPIGRFLNRFSTDISIIDKKMASSVQRLLQFLMLCLSAILVNTVISPWFLLIAIPIGIMYFYIQKFYRMSSRELQRLDSISRSPVLSHLSETLNGLATIRAFSLEIKLIQGFYTNLDQHVNAYLLLNASNRWLGIVLDCLGGLIVFFVMCTCLLTAYFVPHSISPSMMGMAINYSLLVPIYLNWVVKFLADFEMHMGAVERVNRCLKLPIENYTGTVHIPKTWPQNGAISISNLTLGYDNSRYIFTGLHVQISAGQKVGLCGRSGSGKSTFGQSLLRFLNPTQGSITIDGIDISKVPLTILRKRVALIPQDAGLFPGSVRDNLDLTQDLDDFELWQCLDCVGLKDFVENICHGLDSEINEGAELSAGKRQLFCLARAICQKASILVMDEATSNLDKNSEIKLMSAASAAFPGKTMIIIAHRLSTLLECDRILVLHQGRVVEDGPPKLLITKQLGVFATMLRTAQEHTLEYCD